MVADAAVLLAVFIVEPIFAKSVAAAVNSSASANTKDISGLSTVRHCWPSLARSEQPAAERIATCEPLQAFRCNPLVTICHSGNA
ncbi:hypothetical protein LAUMK35_04371 [Mycobacterium pseudokansasii]|nr:hypothetical protein LAUMK35_04371 [Mycobacterium pseudokansasii]